MASTSEAADDGAAAPVIQFKKKSRKGNIIKKRPVTPEKKDSSDDDSSSDDNGLQDARHKAKRRKKGTEVHSSTTADKSLAAILPTVHQADRSVAIKDSNDATKERNWHEENKPGAKIGPTKSASNVRMTTFTEYTLGICKDYKKTGHCGFGDACIFVHDRGDWTGGWKLDQDWDKAVKENKVPKSTVVASADRTRKFDTNNDDDASILENIPFACIICEKSYRDPIVTRCGHYFCESCALTRYRKDPSCAACGAATNGVFNTASRLRKLLQRKKEWEAKKAEAEAEASGAGDA
ncbi:hypothetical protein V2G26_016214 [Clonostachys chloroleuca]